MKNKPKNPAAVALGRISTPAKRRAAQANGLLGGRPRGSKNKVGRKPAIAASAISR